MTVIRQPGWRPPPPPQQCPQQQSPPQPRPLHESLPLLLLPQPQLLTHVNDLPDDLLQRIFSLLPFRKRYLTAVVLLDTAVARPWHWQVVLAHRARKNG